MRINGQHYRTIWLAQDGWRVVVIDQTRLPFRFETVALGSAEQAADAIRNMVVRGAPLIGATAAYGVALAMRVDASDAGLGAALALLGATRPTAVNLRWALERMRRVLASHEPSRRCEAAYREAAAICDEAAHMFMKAGFELRRGRRPVPRDRRARPAVDPLPGGGQAGRRAGQHPHPLQRGLDRHSGLGHGAGSGLSRA